MTFNPELKFADSLQSCHEFLDWIEQAHTLLAFDTETTGLDPHSARLRLVQWSDGKVAWAVPYEWWPRVVHQAAESVAARNVPVVAHNLKYDASVFKAHDLPIPVQTHDTMLMSRMIDPLSNSHGLKALGARYIDGRIPGLDKNLDLVMLRNEWDWATVPVDFDAYWAYGALDTAITHALYHRLWPDLDSLGMVNAYWNEVRVSLLMAAVEGRGLYLDLEQTEAQAEMLEGRAASIARSLRWFGVENPDSSVQVVEALQSAGVVLTERTKTGQYSTDKGTLRDIDHDIARYVLEYRHASKFANNYFRKALRLHDDGTLRCQINPLKARTGRMSISNPPLQQIPSKDLSFRQCVIARPGNSLVAVDYDSMELLVFAHFAQDPALFEALRSGDMHQYIADLVGIPRPIAKNVQYSRLYGAGLDRMARTGGVSPAEMQQAILAIDSKLPGISAFMDKVQRVGREREVTEGVAYVRLPSGRRLLTEPGTYYRLTNYLIQGLCADVLKEAILDLDAAGLSDFLILPIHDELLLETPADEAEEIGQEVSKIMRRDDFTLPLTCEPAIGEKWSMLK